MSMRTELIRGCSKDKISFNLFNNKRTLKYLLKLNWWLIFCFKRMNCCYILKNVTSIFFKYEKSLPWYRSTFCLKDFYIIKTLSDFLFHKYTHENKSITHYYSFLIYIYQEKVYTVELFLLSWLTFIYFV